MITSFKTQKDASFTDDAGKGVAGQFLSDFDGNKFKVYGKVAESVELGVNYEFEVKSTDKYDTQLIDGKTFHKAGEAKPESKHEETTEPRINQQKQSSIEAQHAITKVVELRVGGVIGDDDPLYKAALSYIRDRVMGAENRVVEKGGHLVEAAKQMGAVDRPVKTLGELRTKLAELGLTDQDEQKAACGLTREEPWSNLKGDYVGAYKIAQESISPATTG